MTQKLDFFLSQLDDERIGWFFPCVACTSNNDDEGDEENACETAT